MKQQDIKTEEKFISHNAWFSIFMACTFLFAGVYPILKQTNTAPWLSTVGPLLFITILIIFIAKGFSLSRLFVFTYKDEFLNTIDTLAYKHSGIALSFFIGGVYTTSDRFADSVSHATMAMFYITVMLLVYGISILWQSRD
ncbi:hypothetical protein NQT69_19355 [Pseudoalteromonas shioyasakiensis]|uniref:hypothetical protein n=1 Tax=Pseudoalteromonas shioyasakiensis TaxID=1190813 RepID=UPI002117A1C3|nr:hypothetical protein [Pseudoalteromonas shioyasakiensis]MCQ8880156.1 hypothetical protein [Pseudoalteromonas shioyasakiensis]